MDTTYWLYNHSADNLRYRDSFNWRQFCTHFTFKTLISYRKTSSEKPMSHITNAVVTCLNSAHAGICQCDLPELHQTSVSPHSCG